MAERDNGPRMLGSRDAHALLRTLLAREAPGRILDAACGQGPVAGFLIERGFDVRCCDVDPGLFKLKGVPVDRVELNRPLPYEDASFDCVVCSNAIHRLYNVPGVLREFARILRPGGRLFLTVNNYSNICKRVRFLFYGSLTNKTNEQRFVQTIEAPEANLRQALFFPQVKHNLLDAGLAIDEVRSTRPRLGAWLLLPLALLIRLIMTVWPVHKRESNCLREMNGFGLLPGGKHLAVVASKPKT